MLKNLASFLTILISANCAAVRVQPASLPMSAETDAYVSLNQAEPAPADGFFLSIPAARSVLKAQRLREIDLQEQLAESNLQRDAEAKALAMDQFCVKWCLPIGLIVGVFTGGAFGIWAASKK